MNRKIVLTAEHYNWQLHSIDDWCKTFYILYDNGDVKALVYEDATIKEEGYKITTKELSFIKENIEDYIISVDEIEADDGEAWEFYCNGLMFGPGYIYDSDLELIANILYLESIIEME